MKTKQQPIFDLDQFGQDLIKKLHNGIPKHAKPSLRTLAKSLKISVATLSRVINYGTMPDMKTFAILCEWLEINPQRYFPKCSIFDTTNFDWMD